MITFYFDELNSYEKFKIVAKSIDRSLLPSRRKREMTIPGKHGVYDFEGNTYENRPIQVLIQYVGETFNDLRLRARDISTWLSKPGYKKLVFSDEPDKYYLAKVYDAVGLESIYELGKATVTFECQPFALYVATSGEDLILDNDVPIDSWINLNPVDAYIFDITEAATVNVEYAGSHEVGLESPRGSLFNIIITGSFTTFSISLNGRTLNYTDETTDQTLIIDNVGGTIKVDGVNAMMACTGAIGTFLNLLPGNNTVVISGTGLNCSVLFDFRPQYL